MSARRAGFTLIEVAVTLVIVGYGLVLILQGLHTSKLSAAQTHHRKVARDLGLYTLGQLEAGLFWEELDDTRDVLTGTYAEEGYEEFHYELVLGDEEFAERSGDYRDGGYHDSWLAEREREERLRDDDDDEEEDEIAEPFEKARIKITFPKFGAWPNELVLERWIPWDQVYGTDQESGAAPAEEPE